ncbi:hypothetical protein AB0395_18840 [Streptosporangium sp. NPDC051023]|uniref:hypothetical protein n=1 Tax=Streptosporangium sp. NPDC051023 TaxID=3155410 RepID=UPI00344C0D37
MDGTAMDGTAMDGTAMDGGDMDRGDMDGEMGGATEASNSGPLRDGLHGLVMASSSMRIPKAERGDIK